MKITQFRISKINEEDFEEVLNELTMGFRKYRNKNVGFNYTLEHDDKTITIKFVELDESVN
jgi:hypothetical protein